MSTNDPIAEYNDFIYSNLKSSDINDDEIGMINFLVPPTSKILDIGGGTGRHAIPLSEQGFDLTVVDTSKKMLQNLKDYPSIKVFNQDIFKFETTEKYDLIILMWNTFNEIALTPELATNLLKKIKSMLASQGKVIINIDNSATVDPEHFDFTIKKERDGLEYVLNWKTAEYFKDSNTAISKETLTIYDQGKVVKEVTDFIKQRYWSLDEILDFALKLSFIPKTRKSKISEEIYLILETI